MAEGLDRTLDEMARRDVDVLLLGREGNARFVSEATRLWLAGTRPFAPGCVVVRETAAVHLLSVTDFGVPRDISTDRLHPLSWNPANIVGAVAAIPGVSSARQVGVDGLTPLFEQLLTATLPGAELVDGEAVMRAARRVKSAAEVERIRVAISLAEDAFGASVDALRPGIRERELKGVFEERMCRRGTTTPAFEGTFCVVDGEGPVRCLTSDREIVDGDLVAMSAGVLLDGWEGSLARTWSCGAPTADHRGRRERWDAQWTPLVDRCRSGARVGDLRVTAGASVHGVGLGYEGLEDDALLEPGMVVQLELESVGVLGANVLLIDDRGAEPLTAFPSRPRGGVASAPAPRVSRERTRRGSMADVEAGHGTDTRVVSTWRTPLETAALILLAALVVSIVGAIVGAVFRPGAEAWVKLADLGINVVSPWHVAVLVIAVGLVFALRVPFPPDARGASTARLVLLGAVVLSAVVALCAFLGIIGTIGLDLFGFTIPMKIGEIMELLGGGAVAVAAGLLALRGQSLVPAPVRTPAPPATAPTAAAPGGPGWGADPFGRHQWRYWDGTRWTDQVADGSTQGTDPAQ